MLQNCKNCQRYVHVVLLCFLFGGREGCSCLCGDLVLKCLMTVQGTPHYKQRLSIHWQRRWVFITKLKPNKTTKINISVCTCLHHIFTTTFTYSVTLYNHSLSEEPQRKHCHRNGKLVQNSRSTALGHIYLYC